MKKAFLSYSSKDIDWADKIKNAIASIPLEVFIAEYAIKPGERFSNKIFSEIDTCDIFILIESKNTIGSNWVSREITHAQSKSKNIYPIAIDKDYNPDELLQGISYFLAYKYLEDNALSMIASDISDKLEKAYLCNIFIICGLSSAGKDTVLSYIKEKYLKVRRVHYLTRFTTKTDNLSKDESLATIQRNLAYERKHLLVEKFKEGKELFGIFKKEKNFYGFKRKELKDAILKFKAKEIFIVYSDFFNLLSLEADLKQLTKEIKNLNSSSNLKYSYDIVPWWVLIEASPEDCERRLLGRNLVAGMYNLKKAHIIKDRAILQTLKEENFFDKTVNNSDSNSLNKSTYDLINFIRDKIV